MTANIAEKVRYSRGWWGEAPDLATQAQRLWVSLEVANRWLATADAEEADTLGSRVIMERSTTFDNTSLTGSPGLSHARPEHWGNGLLADVSSGPLRYASAVT